MNKKNMNLPQRHLFHHYFHNLFIDTADIARKEQILEIPWKNRIREREEPPSVLANPSQFAVSASVREAILNKWITFFSAPLENIKDFEETEIKEKRCDCNFKVINIGLKPVLTLLKESRYAQPVLCSKALLALLDSLNQLKPEELFDQPSQILNSIFDILLTTSCLLGPNSSQPDDGTNMAAVASSSLVALVLAKGNTGQILKTIYTLLTSPQSLENQKILLPKICTKLQKSVQALVFGTTNFSLWITHGVPRTSIYDKFPVKFQRDIIPYSMCSDGVFLYIYCSKGLYKVGTGYTNTTKGCIYRYNPSISNEGKGWIGVFQENLFLRIPSREQSLLKLSVKDLDIIDEICLDDSIPWSNGVFFSDAHSLGVISSANDGMSLKVVEIEPSLTKKFIITKDTTLQITEKHSYIIGEQNYDYQTIKSLEPTNFNYGMIKSEDILEIAKGHSFTLIRLSNGKVYFTGSGSVLGNKSSKEDDCPWTELQLSSIEKFHIIKKMAVGHDGQHAVFITEKGVALFSGTSQWGEDGEVPKIGRQPKVIKSKPFIKLRGETIVSASCNYGTSALVTGKGHLYMFGKDACYCDLNGRLNLPNEHVTQVALGKAHVAVLTISGVVFTFGLNNKGQCGRFYETNENEEISHKKSPRRLHGRKVPNTVKRPSKINNAQHSEVPNSKTSDDLYQLAPGPINFREKVVQIACGLYHTVLLTKHGEVYTCGFNLFGQLGIGHTSPNRGIVKLAVPTAKLIAAGSNHTVILTKVGEVYTVGSNNLGQLARNVTINAEIPEAWAAEPGPVVHLGLAFGYKAVWVGASGDSTFINVDKALINMDTLLNTNIASSKQNIIVLPYLSEHTFTCIVINRENGVCKSFHDMEQVKFANSLACLDPCYDVVWRFSAEQQLIKCYNILTINAKHIQKCSLFESTYLKDASDIETIPSNRRVQSILSCELAIPKMENCFITRSQLATHLLACFDTYYTFHSQSLTLHSDTPAAHFYNESGYLFTEINRFLQYREEWDKEVEDGNDAIRFMSDCDLFLGGIKVYGGNGEYMTKVKLFDLGDSDLERDGRLIAESDEVMYECASGCKYPIQFEAPVPIKAHRWYVIWARVSGSVTEFGEEGLSVVPIHGNNIYFGSSKMSTKGTNVNFGQIPTLLVKGAPSFKRTKVDDRHDPIHILSDNFGTNISRQGLDSLQSLLFWSWLKIRSEMWETSHQVTEDVLSKIKHFERLEYINRSTLRLIKSYINHIYPKKGKKKNEESEDLVDGIFEIRQLLIAILGYKVMAPKQESTVTPKFTQIIHSVLKECCSTFQELFHIFYPTSYLKWEILCSLLSNIKDGICTQYSFFLSAVVASLSNCVNLNLVLPVFFPSGSSKFPPRNVILVDKMSKSSIIEFKIDAEKWHLGNTLEHLLELVISQLKKCLDNKSNTNYLENSNDTLINNACDLLNRLVAELAFNAVGELNEDQPNLRGYIISTPNRFLEVNTRYDWNGTPDYPDVVCFDVDRPGISIIGVSIYCSPGKHKYQLEFHEQCSVDALRVPQWKCLEYAKGVFETGYFGDDTVEIKFPRPIPIKENRPYAFRLWNIGKPTKSGEKGIPTVKGPDGTAFNFQKCFLGVSSTSTCRGQIPSILYFRDLSLLSSTESLVKFPPKHILKVAHSIIKKCAHYLNIIRNEYPPDKIINNDSINRAPCLINLIPYTLAHLSHITDPDSCVSILQMVQELLPHVAALNLLHAKHDSKEQKQSLLKTTSQYVWVESGHPYKQATVTNYRVNFPPTVAWMALEMDPRSGTAQPEDSLRIFASRSYDWFRSTLDGEDDSDSSCEFEDDEASEADYYLRSHEMPENIENSPKDTNEKLTMIPITGKMSNNKEDWPKNTIIVPGNEVLFSMETATDYLKNDLGNKYGFKCLVVGYQDFFFRPNCSTDIKINAFSQLEMELTYIGGMCAASLMNPTTLSCPDILPSSSFTDDNETITSPNYSQVNDFDDAENVILSKGFSLEQMPDIQQALTGLLPYKSKSIEFKFLKDFVNCSGTDAGARLARWLQPNPHVELSLCRVEVPTDEILVGQELPVSIHLCDQNGQPLHASDLSVRVVVYSDPQRHNQEVDDLKKSALSPQDLSTSSPTPTFKKNASKYVFSNQAENSHSNPVASNSSKESLIVKVFGFGKLCGVWVPQIPGIYSIQCFIDGQPKDPILVIVKKPVEGCIPQIKKASNKQRKTRNFYTDDSSGLRVRSQPSLQGEQIGVIPVGGSIKFDSVVINGDGLWLQLSEESVVIYCEEPINGTEAWCLQYNEHMGKNFLYPNDKILSYWTKLIQDPIEATKPEYLVMFPTHVLCGNDPSSRIHCTIDAGDIITIEKIHYSDNFTYAKLDKATIMNLGIFEEPGKEYWIMCSPINILSLAYNSNASTGANYQPLESQSDLIKNKKMTDLKKWDKLYGFKSPQRYPPLEENAINSDIDKCTNDIGDERKMCDDMSQHILETSQFTNKKNHKIKNLSFHSDNETMDVSYLCTDDSNGVQYFPGEELNINKDSSTKHNVDSQRSSFCNQEIPRTPDPKIKFELSPKETQPMLSFDKLTKSDEKFKGGIGISLSRAKSFRAVFAAFLWHEGIIHDAMACASYLKFHPTLPKQGAPVLTRNLTHNPSTNISQRHSVEVANAGRYLHIQESSLETLTRSALNASANRARSKKNINNTDVTIIREEDNSASKDSLVRNENDVICVLPSALRALLALWDSMSEVLPHHRVPKKDNDKENIPIEFMKKNPTGVKPKVSEEDVKDSDVNDDSSDNILKISQKTVICKYCNDLVETPFYILHLQQTHPGCLMETDIFCYKQNGERIVTAGKGTCGQIIKGYADNWYTICNVCDTKYMQDREVDMDSEMVDQSESEIDIDQNDNDAENLLLYCHTMLSKNAKFLLHMVPASNRDDTSDKNEQNGSDSSCARSSWSPVTTYQCLKNLNSPIDDASNENIEENIFTHQFSIESNISLNPAEINDNGNSPLKSDDAFNSEPSTSGFFSRFHRSVSMGQDASHMFTKNDSKKVLKPGTPTTTTSTLLCNPSAALQALVDLNGTNAPLSSVSPLKVSKETIMSRPVMNFILKQQNITAVELKMVNSVRVAAMRKYGLEAFNWMLHNVTQPMCLQDLMWWFVDAMNKNSEKIKKKIEKPENIENDNKLPHTIYSWKDSLDKYGNNSHIKLRETLYRFLLSICELMPRLPPASPILLQAVRTCALDFSTQDHLFLHRCGIIKTLSKILTHSEEEYSGETSQKLNKKVDKDRPITNGGVDITMECEIKVSSHPEMMMYLTDGSTETFWESGEIDRNKQSWIQITFPDRVSWGYSFICLHIDNTRDTQNKTELVDFRIKADPEDMQHYKYIHLLSTSNEWLLCSLPVSRNFPTVICELSGYDASVRVRQLIVLDEPFRGQFSPLSKQALLHNHIEVETLKIFKNIASQVFEKMKESDYDSHLESVLSRENNDLKEHMVGVLFSKNKFSSLQKQIMAHIISAVSSETKRTKLAWEKLNFGTSDETLLLDNLLDIADEYSAGADEYCFQMLSMVLALSGSHSGCVYLAENIFIVNDLLTLLHVGSGRILRQVIAILRRMMKDITPIKMDVALQNSANSPNVTLIDHLISCISKSLAVKLKGVAYQNSADAAFQADFYPKISTNSVLLMDCIKTEMTGDLWFMRGQMKHKHTKIVIDLLMDMLHEKISSIWAEATKAYIVNAIFKLTFFSDFEKIPHICLSKPTLWFALGSLAVLQQNEVERLSTLGLDNTMGNNIDPREVTKQYCMNHDDGLTHAMIDCVECGPNCQECDRILHLPSKNRSHKRQVCKAVKNTIRVDVHEGCGRVKLFWLLALVDYQTLKALVEFRSELDNINTNYETTVAGWKTQTPALTGTCRYCGKQNNTGLLAIGNVCADQECQNLSKISCTRLLICGHACGGILNEDPCLPCLHGCASEASSTPMDQAAAVLTPAQPARLRQDAEDMCMICFSEPLSAAPAIQFKCGHVFHYNCSIKILTKKWVGPRITFNFSQCPICKEDISHIALSEYLQTIRELEELVKRKALARLEYEGQKDSSVIALRYKNNATAYAMDKYAYYICFRCNKPYFGGEARCDAGAGANTNFNPEELLCGGCSNVACGQICSKHGVDFLEYKCRFCCTLAVYFCLGNTHFCSGCHDEFQMIRNIPIESLPRCPAGPKGVQLDGAEDDCPLGVRHPPTGHEFSLGCGICRKFQSF